MIKQRPNLADVFKFTQEDLAANHSGKLTARQMELLKKANPFGRKLGCALVMAGFGLLTTACTTFTIAPDYEQESRLKLMGFVFMLVGLFSFVGAVWVYMAPSLEETAKLERACGMASTHRVYIRNAWQYKYSVFINGQSYTLNKQQYEAIRDQHPYCIYYVPLGWRTKHIVAIEPTEASRF